MTDEYLTHFAAELQPNGAWAAEAQYPGQRFSGTYFLSSSAVMRWLAQVIAAARLA